MDGGWIGSWSPGIGDHTIGGWVTVALYVWAARKSFRILQHRRHQKIVLSSNEAMVWRLILAGMIVLGINKQLDLQSALTEMTRILALEQGWYSKRRQYQMAFIAATPVVGLTVLATMVHLAWKAPAPTLWACAGASGLLVFVAIRATSFHGVDEVLGWRLAGLPLNWVFEMTSLVVIAWSARKRDSVLT